MNSKLRGKKQGFTIIEVVLVLAIAGLIFLIVFLALPGLQRSRRDTQRKSDVGNMVAALVNYQSNHGGSFPTPVQSGAVPFSASSCNPGTNCIMQTPDTFNDPSTHNPYKTTANSLTAPSSASGEIYYIKDYKCADNALNISASKGTALVMLKLETGGMYCKDTGS